MLHTADMASPELIDRLAAASLRFEMHYDPQNKFHNYEAHPMGEVLPVALYLANACLSRGIDVNLIQLVGGAMGHDADSTKPLIGGHFANVEERSGSLAVPIMYFAHFSEADAIGTGEIIATTHVDAPYTSVTGALLGLSDPGNVSKPYAYQLNRMLDLWEEYLRLGKFQPEDFEEWVAVTPEFLTRICFKSLPSELYEVPEVLDHLRKMECHIERARHETPLTLAQKFPHRLSLEGAVLLDPVPAEG